MSSLLGGGPGAASERTLVRTAQVLVAVTAVVACIVLVTWFVDQSTLDAYSPGPATLKANTALCLLLLSASLVTGSKLLVPVLTGAVAGISLVSLSQYVADVDLGIDQLLVRDLVTGGVETPGRMAPATAVALVLLSGARWAQHRGADRAAQLLLVGPLVVGSVAQLGYLFQVEQFYRVVAYSTVAFPTALSVNLLSLAVACLVPGGVAWWMAKDPGAGATLVRHMLPVVIVLLPLLAVIPLVGVYTDLFGERFSIALMVAAAAAVLMAVTAVAARRLDRIDDERLAAQAGLQQLNDRLVERRDLEWRRAEALNRSLAEERARFQRAIAKVDDLIWTVEVMPDGSFRPEFTSGNASGIFGDEKPEGPGRALPNLVHPEDKGLLEALDDKIRAGLAGEAELRLVGYDGAVRWVWVRATPRREGDRLLSDGISTNITDRRQLAERREKLLTLEQEQVRKLKQLNQLREELLAVTGHELRTPLAVILGYSELMLLERELSVVQRRHLEVMAKRARQVVLLVEDIFDLAKFSAGLSRIEARPVALHHTLTEVVEEHRPAAAEAGLTIDLDVEPVTVEADPARLRQVLDNLLSNAIKYSLPDGRVEVTAGSADGTATISVSDAGIGIPEGELEHVFDRMYRASSAKDRAIQGTGLGLSVAKVLVEAHDGTISVSRRPGGGTQFTVAIPVRRDGSEPSSGYRFEEPQEGAAMAEQYWFCLKHQAVEGEDGCKSADRLGPYATADEAGRALDKVAERNESWDSDPAWNDEVPPKDA